jgi:hypothetical protein
MLGLVAAILAFGMAGCGPARSSVSAPPSSAATSTTVPVDTVVKIIGNDRKTTVVTYKLPWAMLPGHPDSDFFSGRFPVQSAYGTSDETSGVVAGLLDPATPHRVFNASDTYSLAQAFGVFTTPMVPGRLGGGPAIALACPNAGMPYTARLIVVSTTGGLVWIQMAALDSDTASVRKLLSSIQVLQPGPNTGWYNPTPALKQVPDPRFACVTDTVEATLGIATR